MSTKVRSTWPRHVIQIAFLLLVVAIGLNHASNARQQPFPFLARISAHGICPFGGVESAYHILTTGRMVQQVQESSFGLMWIVFGLAILLGAVFCGWICPLGTVQEFITALSRRLFGTSLQVRVPARLDNYLKYIRYGVLAWVLYATATNGILVFSAVDPYKTLFSFGKELTTGGLVVLAVTLTASIFIERPWCRYACPYGALLGLTNHIRLFKLKRSDEHCTDCRLCEKSCPMNVDVLKSKVIADVRCISCMECTSGSACRRDGTLKFKI